MAMFAILHAPDIAAVDLFVVPTVGLGLPHVARLGKTTLPNG